MLLTVYIYSFLNGRHITKLVPPYADPQVLLGLRIKILKDKILLKSLKLNEIVAFYMSGYSKFVFQIAIMSLFTLTLKVKIYL